MARSNDLRRDHNQALRATFSRHAGNDGALQEDELAGCLEEMGVRVRAEDLREMLRAVDRDGGGDLSFEEFAQLFEEGKLRSVFEEMDADGSGTIDATELRAAFRKLGYQVSSIDLKLMFRSVDASGDGLVDFAEFKQCFQAVPLASVGSIAKQWASIAGAETGSDIAPPTPPQGVPSSVFLVAGGTAGALARTVTAPLDKIKIVAQTCGKRISIAEEVRAIYRAGGARAFWAGNLANVVRVFPYLGITTAMYRYLLKLTPADDEVDAMEPVYRGGCAAAAGIVGQVCTYPMDVVRARLTLRNDGGGGILGAARAVYAEGGVRALYRGLFATCAAVAPFLAIQLPTLDILKSLAAERGVKVDTTFLLCGGAFAGGLAQTVVYPLDLLRRRLQVGGQAAEGVVSDSTWLSIRSIVRREGLRGLFAGIGPTYLKVMPATATGMTTAASIVGYYQSQQERR